MTTPIVVGGSLAAIGLIVALRSNLSLRRRVVIAGALAASIGALASCWISIRAFERQRNAVDDYCGRLANDLVIMRTDLEYAKKIPDVLPEYEIAWRKALHGSAVISARICIPDPETCTPYIEDQPKDSPEFLHALDVLIDAFDHHRPCPKP